VGKQARTPSKNLVLSSTMLFCATILGLISNGMAVRAEFTARGSSPFVVSLHPGFQAPRAPARDNQVSNHDALTDAALEHFYNLDYDRATQEFEKVVEKHPNDVFACNHLITSLLMHELYKMGAMNTGEYANDSFIGQVHHSPDPKVKERIKRLVDRAEDLEEQQLKANPNNVEALYARGVTRAQFALYTGLV